MPNDNTNKIATLNDEFRKTLMGITYMEGKFIHPSDRPKGTVTVTSGIHGLEPQAMLQLFREVATFDRFTPDNDPHGEHDFGSLELDREKVFWKIDCYDPDMKHHSEDPADPQKTHRVLTIMFAHEY